MKATIPLIILFLTSSGANAFDNPSMKDGNPCFKEVCIGDEITHIRGVKWEGDKAPSRASYKSTELEIKRLRTVIKGTDTELQRIAYFWIVNDYNTEGLAALATLDSVCQRFKGNLTYLSESGYRTLVSFEPFPSADGGRTQYLVTSLSRSYPTTWTKDQRAEFGREIQNRYVGIDSTNIKKSTFSWWPSGFTGNGVPSLTLSGPSHDALKRNDLLKMQPGCGGSDKPKFD